MSLRFWMLAFFVMIGLGGFFGYKHFTTDHHMNIPEFVDSAIEHYTDEGVNAFPEFSDQTSLEWVKDDGEIYIFVINAGSGQLLAHGGGLTQDKVTPLTVALISYIVEASKEEPDGRWIYYGFTNPANDKVELKKTYVKMKNGYVFGSGKYKDRHHRDH